MDPMTEVMEKMKKEIDEAKAKYEPMVKRLTDASFIAIFQVVQEERTRRITHLILTNPAVRQAAIQQMVEQIREEEQAERN